jgi:hypothetical protein
MMLPGESCVGPDTTRRGWYTERDHQHGQQSTYPIPGPHGMSRRLPARK